MGQHGQGAAQGSVGQLATLESQKDPQDVVIEGYWVREELHGGQKSVPH